MRILQIVTSLEIGGAEKLVADISPMLQDLGHDVDVLAFSDEGPNFRSLLENKGVKVYTCSHKRNVYNPMNICHILRMMGKYDIVHTHNTAPQLFTAIASHFHSTKLITTEHNTSNRRRDIKGASVVDKWMYRRYNKIICISDKAEENLRNYLPSLKNICTIYNGVDVQKFYNAKPLENIVDESKVVVAMVAGFRKQKDQDTLIKAFSQLSKEKYRLWIIGDGDRREELEHLTNQLQLDDVVKFWGIRSDVPEILHSADIICMSSHYEGLSLSSVEGMSVGKPFIATDVDGLHEVVENYGVLVPHNDEKALAKVISELAENKDYYERIANQCWQRAKQFDITKMVDAYNNIYNSIMISQ